MSPLGRSPLTVSAVGLGCNNFGRVGAASEEQRGTSAVVAAALEAGVTFFDTADSYGKEFGLSESLLGAALRGHRDEVVIATKFGHASIPSPILDAGNKGSPAYIRRAVEGSLTRLGTDYIDLYQQHTPDPSTPIAETLGALADLVTEGKVRAIGHSNFDAGQIANAHSEATRLGSPEFVSAQDEYNLVARGVEADVLPAVRDADLSFLPYFPLANGLLTGKFTRTERPADTRISRQRPHVADDAPWDSLEAYARFCAERGISMLEATFGWLLAQPALASVIAGATTAEQVRQNAAAGSRWQPTGEDLALIDSWFPPSSNEK